MTRTIIKAWGVHLYTGLGAVTGFLALVSIFQGAYGAAFAWMTLATFIDCTDGTLARKMRVKQVLPHFDGARLDDIVDYLNYVVVPVVLAYHAHLIPSGPIGLAASAMPLLASGYGFCQLDAKTEDHFFKGFPSYWNVVVFYFFTLRCPVWFNVAAFTVFSIGVFIPIRYLYPSKNTTAQRTTYALGTLWAVLMIGLLLQFPDPSRALAVVSLFFPAYYLAMSFHLHFRPGTG